MNAQLLYIFVNSPLVKVHCRHLMLPEYEVKKSINELASSPVFMLLKCEVREVKKA